MKGKRSAVAGVLAVLAVAGLTTMAGCSSDDSGGTGSVAESTGQGTTGAGETGGGAYGADKSPGDGAAAGKPDDGTAQVAGAAQPGEYVDYSPELVASTPGDKLLFFHASWCSQCQALEEDIEANGLPDGVTVFKVDYDSNQDLRQEYGATIQTTMVKVDDNGDKIDSYVAYEDPTFENVSAALLQ